jgi:inner membrane protein
MTGKTHQSIGITVSLGTYLASTNAGYEPATFAAVLMVAMIGSLLPDADSAGSEIWHSLPFGHTAGRVAGTVLSHRNITHSILGFVLIGLGVHYLIGLAPIYWGWDKGLVFMSFLIAYGSHVVADMFTEQGVPLLYPYQRTFGIPPRPFEAVRIVTGKWFENLIIFPIVNVVLIVIITTKWESIKTIILK